MKQENLIFFLIKNPNFSGNASEISFNTAENGFFSQKKRPGSGGKSVQACYSILTFFTADPK